MAPMNTEQIIETDLLRTSTHEAAHLVIGRELGVPVLGIEITPTACGDGAAVAGRVHWYRGARVSKTALAAFGLAGVAAEWVLDNPNADDGDAFDWIESIWETASGSDRSATGKLTAAKVSRALTVVRGNWADIEQEAAWARDAFRLERQQAA